MVADDVRRRTLATMNTSASLPRRLRRLLRFLNSPWVVGWRPYRGSWANNRLLRGVPGVSAVGRGAGFVCRPRAESRCRHSQCAGVELLVRSTAVYVRHCQRKGCADVRCTSRGRARDGSTHDPAASATSCRTRTRGTRHGALPPDSRVGGSEGFRGPARRHHPAIERGIQSRRRRTAAR